jgi:Ssp1 endopeptidase immunity protein Rap1a
VNKALIILLVAIPAIALAEDDGNELLAFMQQPAAHGVALAYIDNVRTQWDGTLFCIPGDDRQAQAFDAVKLYLEANPEQRFRPRRYLIIQGLRAAYPCEAR